MKFPLGNFDRSFLHSRVARRIFALFILCALLPVGALALISLSYVTRELYEGTQKRLRQASKAMALSVYERLSFLEAETKIVASTIDAENSSPGSVRRIGRELAGKFKGMAIVDDIGRYRVVFGTIENPPKTTLQEYRHIQAGKSAVSAEYLPGRPARVFIKILDPQRPKRGVLVAELEPEYLWGVGAENTLPFATDLCVLDQSNNILISSLPSPDSHDSEIAVKVGGSSSGQFEWKLNGKGYLAGYWTLPLRFRFLVPQWTIVLSESRAGVLAPIVNFKKTFFFVTLLALCLVLLLSISQIRRSMVPLEKLQEGTRRIAERNFGHRVAVESGDEFEDLAASFNSMAGRLAKQFDTLATMAEIDRVILSALDTEKILETVLQRIRNIFPCDRVSVTLLDPAGGAPKTHVKDSGAGSQTRAEAFPLTSEEMREACNRSERLFTEGRNVPPFLAPFFSPRMRSLLVLPISVRERMSGMITLGYAQAPSFTEDDLLQAHQLADQIAVAIHNAQLYEQTKRQAIDLQKSNRVKDEFLSVMSHELRTPLTTITGYAGMLKDKMIGDINHEQERALEKVLQRSGELLGMINGVLYATSLEANTVRVQKSELRLSEFLDELKSDYFGPLEKAISLNWDYASELPSIKTDEFKLKHILQNLINNALKFTEKGRVTISAKICQQEARGSRLSAITDQRSAIRNPTPAISQLELKVADTGLGISKEHLPFVFDKFRQGDSSETRLHGGIGMGLYIAKKFTDLLGGTIEVKSEPGEGSTFTVKIPCAE